MAGIRQQESVNLNLECSCSKKLVKLRNVTTVPGSEVNERTRFGPERPRYFFPTAVAMHKTEKGGVTNQRGGVTRGGNTLAMGGGGLN